MRLRPIVLALVVGLATSAAPAVREAASPMDAAFTLEATGCPVVNAFGGGLAVAPGKILTSAHVIAGAPNITVYARGLAWQATVTAFDPTLDLAMLQVAEWATPVTVPIGTPKLDALGTITVVRDGQSVALPVRIRQLATIQTEDIYVEGHYDRPGYILGTAIRAGDSGNVVVVDHKAVAVLWARSTDNNDTAWGINPTSMVPLLGRSTPIEHGHCH
jgi:hypothetical protein